MKKIIIPVFLFFGLISAELSCNSSTSNLLPNRHNNIPQTIHKFDDELPRQAAPMSRELARLKEIERILTGRIGQFTGKSKMIKKPPKIPAMKKELERQKKIEEILRNRIIFSFE